MTATPRRATRRPAPAERGAATVLVLVAATVLLVLGVLAATVATVVAAGAQARTAADLAALAAADSIAAGQPCPTAGRVARANAAVLVACDLTATAVTVVVEVRTPATFGRVVRARARAEPGGWSGRTLNSGLPEPES